jgi:D-alanine-D-alanine ligase-like ATP-grasp enzyme
LETLGLSYTHSGVLASALAMDKAKAKAVLAAAGVTVPGGGLFNRFDVAKAHVMAPPYVVKPNAEGSSVGVFLVFEGANGPPQDVIAPDWTFGEEVMVEPGRGICLMPEDIHSIHTTGSGPTRHLHMYGLALEVLDHRQGYDDETGVVTGYNKAFMKPSLAPKG